MLMILYGFVDYYILHWFVFFRYGSQLILNCELSAGDVVTVSPKLHHL